MKTLALAAALTLLPAAAFAQCGPVQHGHTTIGCEQGVQVFRTAQPHLPRIIPSDSARLDLQRDALAQRRVEAQLADARARDRLAIDRARLRQTDFLYRDARSPLRPYGYNGFTTYGGLNGGFLPGRFAPVIGTPVRGRIAPRRTGRRVAPKH